MRIPAIILSAALIVSTGVLVQAQDGQKPRKDVDIVASSDLTRLVMIHKQAQGGAERYDGVRTISFDYTPSRIDEKGEEVFANTRHIIVSVRVNDDDQELRTVRIESEIEVPGESEGTKVKIVSLVKADGSVQVWNEAVDGTYNVVETKELKRNAHFDAQSVFAQLDLLMVLDSKDLRCSFTGIFTRDSKRYAAVEAEFRPGRAVPEPSRLYFSSKTSLIERIDVFNAKTHLRQSSSYVENYKDHDGFKFPEKLRFVNRKGEPLGGWRMENVKLNPTLAENCFSKP